MKHIMIIVAATLSIAACTSQPDKAADLSDPISSRSDSNGNMPGIQTICFQNLRGTSNQDTSTLKLVIDGDKVAGVFGQYPKEKDRRVGRIDARRDGNLIKGIWLYMQEGTNDTLQIEFKISGDKLVQKNYTVDAKTGREVFSDASIFNIEFEKVDCKN